jgi:hypothetical protein
MRYFTRCSRRKVRWNVVATGYIYQFLASLIARDSLYGTNWLTKLPGDRSGRGSISSCRVSSTCLHFPCVVHDYRKGHHWVHAALWALGICPWCSISSPTRTASSSPSIIIQPSWQNGILFLCDRQRGHLSNLCVLMPNKSPTLQLGLNCGKASHYQAAGPVSCDDGDG